MLLMDQVEVDRLRAVQRGLRMRALAALTAAVSADSVPQAAALRGKSRGYMEAADMIETVIRGGVVHRKYDWVC